MARALSGGCAPCNDEPGTAADGTAYERPNAMETIAARRTLGQPVKELLEFLIAHFDRQRLDAVAQREQRRAALRAGDAGRLADTAHVRDTEWRVDPLPGVLRERRVELLCGCTRSELIRGLDTGADLCIADLWNLTAGDPWSIIRAHRAIERAARMEIWSLDREAGRVRPRTGLGTRLAIAPRPLHVLEGAALIGDEPAPAAFFDLAMLAVHALAPLSERQGGLFLLLRDVHGHLEARLWGRMLDEIELRAGLPRGTIRVTVMIDSVAAALEADEILFELMHHAAGLSFDPQGYVADHIGLFNGNEVHVFPDREAIGLDNPMLRALGLELLTIAHHRGCAAIGAPTFTLPPVDPLRVKPAYQEMIADKERDAMDGFDGTLVVHPDTVAPVMELFKAHTPMGNQLDVLRHEHAAPADLLRRPEGAISVESLVGTIRTVLRAMVMRWQGKAWVVQGGRLHDRSSVRLALRLLWHWARSRHGVITATGLEVHDDLLRYLVRKEADKMFAEEDERTKELARRAVRTTLQLVLSEHVPLEPQA
jgi:malate synthase